MFVPLLALCFASTFAPQGLHEAAERGDAERVRSLLHLGQRPDRPSPKRAGRTPLHCAAEADGAEVVRALVEAGAQVDACTDAGWTPLHLAAACGELAAARELVAAKADLEARDGRGDRALHLAAENGWSELASLLVELGAEVEARDAFGRTPLLRAAQLGELESARALLAAGAQVDARSAALECALDAAARGGDEPLYALLVSKGADAERPDGFGCTPRERLECALHPATRELDPEERAAIEVCRGEPPLFVAWITYGYWIVEQPNGALVAVWADGAVLFAADVAVPGRAMRVGRLAPRELAALRNAIDESGLPGSYAGVSGPDSSDVELLDLRGAEPGILSVELGRLRELKAHETFVEPRRALNGWRRAHAALLGARPAASCALEAIAPDGVFRGWRAGVNLWTWIPGLGR